MRHYESRKPETKKARISASLLNGGAGTKSRTRDLLITSQLLYQLSYTGMGWHYIEMGRSVKCLEQRKAESSIKSVFFVDIPLVHYFSSFT